MGGRRVCSTFIKLKHGGKPTAAYICTVYFRLLLSVSTDDLHPADNEVDIFNPDCPMKLLVDSVRKRCAAPSREPEPPE